MFDELSPESNSYSRRWACTCFYVNVKSANFGVIRTPNLLRLRLDGGALISNRRRRLTRLPETAF
jgi:hypothetical protein